MAINAYRQLLYCLFETQLFVSTAQAMSISLGVPAMSAAVGGTQLMAQQPVGYGIQQLQPVLVPTSVGTGLGNAIANPVTGTNGVIVPVISVPVVPVGIMLSSAGNPAVSNADATPKAMPPPAAAPADSAPQPAAPETADEAARNDELPAYPPAASAQQAERAQ